MSAWPDEAIAQPVDKREMWMVRDDENEKRSKLKFKTVVK